MAVRKDGRVVMKSPSHTYRVPALLELFPDARFVYIRRDPRAVYQSTMHLRKTMFAENTLGSMRPDVWSEETLYLYEKCIRKYESTKHLIPSGHLFELRFEDLEASPFATLQALHQSLGLEGWSEAEPLVRTECEKLAGYRKNAYRMPPKLVSLSNPASSGFSNSTVIRSVPKNAPASDDIARLRQDLSVRQRPR
ncbi:MAG UNVERIFIED_CONTAM: sulfotransferase [Planctomycetaceae bacterium]|jgi:hypothetical protein